MHTQAYLWTSVEATNSGFSSKAYRAQESHSGTQLEAFLIQVKAMELQQGAGEHIQAKSYTCEAASSPSSPVGFLEPPNKSSNFTFVR